MKEFFCFLHIFRTLRLRLEGTRKKPSRLASLAFRSLRLRLEGTLARKNSNKFGFSSLNRTFAPIYYDWSLLT